MRRKNHEASINLYVLFRLQGHSARMQVTTNVVHRNGRAQIPRSRHCAAADGRGEND